jgi:predicted RNA-binding Zn-ribbon protein involved in translation (DUF1610 family)
MSSETIKFSNNTPSDPLVNKLRYEYETTSPASATKSHKYPSEVIELPTEGFFYSEGSPLSKGVVDIKYMTAREEDILTSNNLIKKGIVLTKLLEALILTEGVKLEDILVCDKNAIYIQARILAYGSDYDVKIKCPECSEESTQRINLSSLKCKPYDFTSHTKGKNEFTFTLPNSQRVITFKLLTGKDEEAIAAEIKSLSKLKSDVGAETTTRLKYLITSFDGNHDTSTIRKGVDELRATDARALRKYIDEVTPDLDMSFTFSCPHCNHQEVMTIPIGINFFWPDARV